MKSASGEFNAEDFVKSLTAGFWNAVSLAGVLVPIIVALPPEQIPDWLLWLIPSAGFVNAVLFGIYKWRKDNRGF